MKITKMDLSWFRGASEGVCLETDDKSVVIYGDNATGKSSFADAFEYIMTEGRIEHLAHEYKNREHKNCLRNTSAPSDAIARATIEFDTGESVSIVIPQDETNYFESDPPEFLSTFQSWRLLQHLLRQNEIADFIEKTKGRKYSVLLPLLGLDFIEQIAGNFSSIISQVESESRLDYLNGVATILEEDTRKHFPEIKDEAINLLVTERAKKYGIEPLKDSIEVAVQAVEEIKKRERELAPDIQRTATAKRIMDINVVEDLGDFLKTYRETEDIRDEVIEYKINILEESTKFAEIQEGEIIECPACGREVAITDFRDHVTSELESLREYNQLKNKIERIKRNVSTKIERILTFAKSDEHFLAWLEGSPENRANNAYICIERSPLKDHKNSWFPTDATTVRDCIVALSEELEKGFVEEPKESSELYDDRTFFEATLKIPEYKEVKDKIKKINILLKELRDIHSAIRGKISEKTRNILDEISEDIRRIWGKLHPYEPIEDIALIIPEGSDTAIDISLKFFGTQQPSPRLTLSEGYRNSLGLSVFIAFANQGDAIDHPIILDDIVSSLDSNHMGMVADLFNEELADRQIILLTHDDTWYKRLLTRLDRSKWKFYRLLPWENPETGIRLTPTHYTFSEAYELLPSNPRAAGNAVRAIMDTTIPQYAQNLGLRMPFIWGPKNDDRTNHDYLNYLISEGRSRFQIKNEEGNWEVNELAISTWDEADRLLMAWSNPPSHGGGIAPGEVRRLVEVCERALDCFRCEDCSTFLWRMQDGDKKLCRCGSIRWK